MVIIFYCPCLNALGSPSRPAESKKTDTSPSPGAPSQLCDALSILISLITIFIQSPNETHLAMERRGNDLFDHFFGRAYI
jgi:hypothetical protein